MTLNGSRNAAALLLLALIVLTLAWEIWLAPLRPGGSMLALKALPLALPLGGVLAGRRYTYQWSCLLMLAYLFEGLARSWTDEGTSYVLALCEIVLALLYLASAIGYIRASRNAARVAPAASA
jgi:uncharacterized membrane protein